jgi:hypothetical protein
VSDASSHIERGQRPIGRSGVHYQNRCRQKSGFGGTVSGEGSTHHDAVSKRPTTLEAIGGVEQGTNRIGHPSKNNVMSKKSIIITGLGVLVGLIAGYVYYHYVGCMSGTCAITSKPLNSTLYGGLMGGLFFNLFVREKPKSD